MAVTNQHVKLLETLQDGFGAEDVDRAEKIFLTPYLALACGLLYMMASDGELEAEESSQLQAVLGGDKAVLSYALRYVQSVPVEQFFVAANELLSVKDKWCILANVCDALLSDGHADPAELALFAQMTQAFGLTSSQFDPYFKILALKNDKSVLGRYEGVRDERQPMTPHFALAIALLYMLTADGSIGDQEIGQLEAVIGEFEGLQNVALKYVRTVKLKQFLDEASVLLSDDQKIYILTNVCDSMLSDGEVALLEDKLFINMLSAFEFTEKTFGRYLQVLETKNLKPFDTRSFENHVAHDRLIIGDDADGVVFKNQRSDLNASGKPQDASGVAVEGVWVGANDNTAMSQFIARTMQENIQSVSDDFVTQDNVVKVGLNATDALNVQTIEVSAHDPNKQKIESDSRDPNRQLLGADAEGANRQAIAQEGSGAHRETLSPEVRAQNIHQVVEVVHQRLDHFETDNHDFLKIGRAQKFTDDFVPIPEPAIDVNRQRLITSSERQTAGIVWDDASTPSVLGSMHAHDTLTAEQALLSAGAPAESRRKWGGFLGYRGKVRWVNHSRSFSFGYVQWVVATLAIVFAAPIGTQTISARSFAGALVKVSIVAPQP